MADKWPEKEEQEVSYALGQVKFKYYPKFDLGIGAEWMGTADNTDVGVNGITSLLNFGFELDFLESMDMSVFDSCLDSEESTVDGFKITVTNSAGP